MTGPVRCLEGQRVGRRRFQDDFSNLFGRGKEKGCELSKLDGIRIMTFDFVCTEVQDFRSTR